MLKDNHFQNNLLYHDFYDRIKSYPRAMKADVLHGFLTGVAMGPAEILHQPWLSVALGIEQGASAPEDLKESAEKIIDEISTLLSEGLFHPIIPSVEYRDRFPMLRMDLWCQGFMCAVDLVNDAWQKRIQHDHRMEGAINTLLAISNPRQHGHLLYNPNVDLNNGLILINLRTQTQPTIRYMVTILPLEEGDDETEATLPTEERDEETKKPAPPNGVH